MVVTVWNIRLFQDTFEIFQKVHNQNISVHCDQVRFWWPSPRRWALIGTEGLVCRRFVGADHPASGPTASLTGRFLEQNLEVNYSAKKVELVVLVSIVVLVVVGHNIKWSSDLSDHIEDNHFNSWPR